MSTSRRRPKPEPKPEPPAEDPIAKQLALLAVAVTSLDQRLTAVESKLSKPSWWEWLAK